MITIKYGDVIYVKRGFYEHFGIYSGGRKVIHYVKETDSGFDGVISETSFEEFLGDDDCYVCRFDALGRQLLRREPKSIFGCLKEIYDLTCGEQATIFSAEETVARARSCIGRRDYDLFGHNCEHFAVWCKTGVAKSEQVEKITQGFLDFAEEALVKGFLRQK